MSIAISITITPIHATRVKDEGRESAGGVQRRVEADQEWLEREREMEVEEPDDDAPGPLLEGKRPMQQRRDRFPLSLPAPVSSCPHTRVVGALRDLIVRRAVALKDSLSDVTLRGRPLPIISGRWPPHGLFGSSMIGCLCRTSFGRQISNSERPFLACKHCSQNSANRLECTLKDQIERTRSKTANGVSEYGICHVTKIMPPITPYSHIPFSDGTRETQRNTGMLT